MIEDAIQNDVDVLFAGVLDQIIPIFLRAEIGIDFVVVLGIVAVIGTAIKDGVEVDGGDAERFEIIEPFIHALEIAAEIITSARTFLGGAVIGRGGIEAPRTISCAIRVVAAVAFGQCSPLEFNDRIIVADITGLRVVVVAAVEETVWEDLIDACLLYTSDAADE